MQKLLEKINSFDYGVTGKPVTDKDISQYQENLSDCSYPNIPSDVVLFLKHHNGFLCEGRCIWGINTKENYLYDILGENVMSQNPNPDELLLLGATEMTYIGYFASTDTYSMIDKSSFMVLHDFNNFVEAAKYILKIDD